jgi:type I restriction enzyme R subunit
MTPEEPARQEIDRQLTGAGWVVQDRSAISLSVARGVAIREVSLTPGHGEADYLLFADGRPIGSVEAKPEGFTLRGVEIQSDKYLTAVNAVYRLVKFGRAARLFGERLEPLLAELNEALVA